jgi:hemolysin III
VTLRDELIPDGGAGGASQSGATRQRSVTPTRPCEMLYDSRRKLEYAKPAWRGLSHLIWFEASVVVGTLLVVAADGATRTSAAAVYAASVCGLFGVSALYHRVSWQPRARSIVQRFDHLMIFVLIAGTATPVFILAAPGTYGRVCLIVIWALTLAATVIHLVWMNAPDWLVGGTFISLGLIAGLALPQIWIHVGVVAAVLVVVGGAIYIGGAVAYYLRNPDPVPAVFGYHEVFHACVCAAATCHYVVIAMLVLRS